MALAALPENDVTAPTEAREDQDEERAGKHATQLVGYKLVQL